MSCGVLVVDDERTLARNIQSYLAHHGYDARCAGSGEEALRQLRGGFSPAVILLDLRLPDADGLDLLPRVRVFAPTARTVIMTGYGSFPTAVLAIKAGAVDYLPKPVVLRELKDLIERVRGAAPAAGDGEGSDALGAILGDSPAIRELRARVAHLLERERRSGQIAPAVLVVGETGSGKELVARALHLGSAKAKGPLVELDCTALPDSLVEAQLFGQERDAVANAPEARPGLIEAADGGTLFLDEVGDLGPAVQAKLLRFLEDRKVRRLGALQERPVDARVLAATHQPLEDLVREGRFRADLYFRLRVVELRVPPLRERPSDVLPLARAFLAESARRWRRPDLRLTPAAEERLVAHAWPGNVRELKNVVEQAAVMVTGYEIGPADLGLTPLGGRPAEAAGGGGDEPFRLPEVGLPIGDVERGMLHQALARSNWNVTAAARLLGLSRDAVRYRMQKHGLLRPS